MAQYAIERKSHCHFCGKRLSEKKQIGAVHWMPCHVDDHGICCEDCFKPKPKGPVRKETHL